jgi:hypothetical protein
MLLQPLLIVQGQMNSLSHFETVLILNWIPVQMHTHNCLSFVNADIPPKVVIQNLVWLSKCLRSHSAPLPPRPHCHKHGTLRLTHASWEFFFLKREKYVDIFAFYFYFLLLKQLAFCFIFILKIADDLAGICRHFIATKALKWPVITMMDVCLLFWVILGPLLSCTN